MPGHCKLKIGDLRLKILLRPEMVDKKDNQRSQISPKQLFVFICVYSWLK